MTKHTKIRTNLVDNRKLEFDLILSQMKKEFEWTGLVGYQNMVMLDPDSPLQNPRSKTIKLTNDKYKTIRV